MDATRFFAPSVNLDAWRNGTDEHLTLAQACSHLRKAPEWGPRIRLIHDDRVSMEDFCAFLFTADWYDASWGEGPFTLDEVRNMVETGNVSPFSFHLSRRPSLTYRSIRELFVETD